MFASTLHSDLMKSQQFEIAAAAAAKGPRDFAREQSVATTSRRIRRQRWIWLRVAGRA